MIESEAANEKKFTKDHWLNLLAITSEAGIVHTINCIVDKYPNNKKCMAEIKGTGSKSIIGSLPKKNKKTAQNKNKLILMKISLNINRKIVFINVKISAFLKDIFPSLFFNSFLKSIFIIIKNKFI